jgi:hypothetical protein
MSTTTSNGAFPRTAREAAGLYLEKGLAPIPLPPRSKKAVQSGWPQLRLTPDTLDEHFPPGQALNVGILNGEPSGNILDVDLDCPEAIRAAQVLLPKTGWVFGRKGARGSHWIYRADVSLDGAQEKYTDLANPDDPEGPDGAVLVELRGTGGLTVFPPSTHKDTGEAIAWESFTDPGVMKLEDLRRCVRGVAAAALLARHWPAKGTRQDAFLALAGALLRAGLDPARVERFLEAVAGATRDEEAAKRVQTVAQTARKIEAGEKVTGWPSLQELLRGDAALRPGGRPRGRDLPPRGVPEALQGGRLVTPSE